MAAFVWIFALGLLLAFIADCKAADNMCSGNPAPVLEQEETVLLQLKSAFVPASERNPDALLRNSNAQLNPGLGHRFVEPRIPPLGTASSASSLSPPPLAEPDWDSPLNELDSASPAEFLPPLSPASFPEASPKLPPFPVFTPTLNSASFPKARHAEYKLPPSPATPSALAESGSADPTDCPESLLSGQGDGTFWRCISDKTCIQHANRCDGQTNCKDGSDELYCNTQLQTRIHALASRNTELEDEVIGLRTGNAERMAEFNDLGASFRSVNHSLNAGFEALKSSTNPHFKLQTDLEVLNARSVQLQNGIDAVQTSSNKRQADINTILSNAVHLKAAVNGLKLENGELQQQVKALKEDYIKLQIALHPA